MKVKVLSRLFITAALAAALCSGCGGDVSNGEALSAEAAQEYLEKTSEKLGKAESFTSTFNAEIQMDENDSVTTMAANVSMTYEPKDAGIDMTSTYNDEDSTSHIYLKEVDDENLNLYMAYGDEWTEISATNTTADKTIGVYDSVSNMKLLLEQGDSWQPVSAEGDVITLTGLIPAEKAYEFLEGGNFMQLTGMSGIGDEYYANVEDIEVQVQLKADGTPVGFSIDLTKPLQTVVSNVMAELDDGSFGMTIGEYTISQSISGLDNVDEIAIPEAAEDAINYEQEITLYSQNAQ